MDHRGNPFQPWEGLEAKSQELCEKLQAILRVRVPPGCFPGLPPPLLFSLWAFIYVWATQSLHCSMQGLLSSLGGGAAQASLIAKQGLQGGLRNSLVVAGT